MRPFPNTAEELLLALEQLVPEPDHRPGASLEEIMHEAGRRSLVREVRAWRERGVAPILREKRGQGRVSRQDA